MSQICHAGHATNKAASLYTQLVLTADMSCNGQQLQHCKAYCNLTNAVLLHCKSMHVMQCCTAASLTYGAPCKSKGNGVQANLQ